MPIQPHRGPGARNDSRTSVFQPEKNGPHSGPYGFTLVEMIVVMTIVVVIMLLALPAARRLWEDRKLADAENAVAGAMAVTRARALQATDGETGLFFYVDEKGVQRIAPIAQAKVALGEGPPGQEEAYRLAHGNVFTVQQGKNWSFSAPLRVVPRYVVEPKNSGVEDWDVFDADGAELSNNSVDEPPLTGVNQAQRHRNFFTMIFNTQGYLVVKRDVVIQDEDADRNNLGDLTGLRIAQDYKGSTSAGTPEAKVYYQRDSAMSTTLPLDFVQNGSIAVSRLVVGAEANHKNALNFPSVDGLLVYEDALMASFDPADKRDYLLRTSQPLYTNRLTGALIRGPVGEYVSVK